MGRFHSSTNEPGTALPPVVLPVPQPPACPAALAGTKLHIRACELPVELKFLSSTNGMEEVGESHHGADLPEVPFSYEYAVLSSNTASLVVNFADNSFDGDRNEYDLTFTDGASGTFTRRIIRGEWSAQAIAGYLGRTILNLRLVMIPVGAQAVEGTGALTMGRCTPEGLSLIENTYARRLLNASASFFLFV